MIFKRHRKLSTDAIYCAAIEDTEATGRGELNAACANSIGAVLFTAKRVYVKWRCTPVCDRIFLLDCQQFPKLN